MNTICLRKEFFFLFICFFSSCKAAPPLVSSELSLFEFSKRKRCPLKPKKIRIQGLFGKIHIKPSKELRLEYKDISDELAQLIDVVCYKPSTQKSRLNIDASVIKLKNSSQKSAVFYRSASFDPFSQQANALGVEQTRFTASDHRVEIEGEEATNAIFCIHLPSSVDELELAVTTFPIVAQFEEKFDGKFYLAANQPCKLLNSEIATIDASVMGEASSLVLDKTRVEKLNARLVNGGALHYTHSSIREGNKDEIEVEVLGKLQYGSHEWILGAGKANLQSMIQELQAGKPEKQALEIMKECR